MTDRASLADAIAQMVIDNIQTHGFWKIDTGHIAIWSPEAKGYIAKDIADALRTSPPDHTALVQALLATCDRLGMTNRPADAPAAFARVLGEFGGSGASGDACRAAAEEILRDVIGENEQNYFFAQHADEIVAIIARHLPPDRYGEGFAAGVEAAGEKCREMLRNMGEGGVGAVIQLAVRALTPHGDDHG